MKTTLSIIFAVITSVISDVTVPFGLYTKSEDPAWNMRYISVGARTGYVSIGDQITNPSQIPTQDINYVISTLTPNASVGNLVWRAQAPYSALYGSIGIVYPSDALQPLFHTAQSSAQGYSTQWNFTTYGQLLLEGESKFYGKTLHAPFWNSDAVHWLFGTTDQALAGASPITIWRFVPFVTQSMG